MKIKIRNIALASYLDYKKIKLIDYEAPYFIFESSESEKKWQLEYYDSEFAKFDASVMKLRNFKSN